jgi:hypothetical protein
MIEVSITEIFLFAWGALATALYLRERHQERMTRHVLMLFIENPDAREEIVKAHSHWKARNGV